MLDVLPNRQSITKTKSKRKIILFFPMFLRAWFYSEKRKDTNKFETHYTQQKP